MAKKKAAADSGSVNKSQAIRHALEENPSASPKEVAEIINAKHALGVTPQYVSVVKSQSKKGGKSSRSGSRARTTAAARSTKAMDARTVARPDVFEAAIGLIEAAGGLDEARATLGRLERLRGKL
jgi:hypothetical protein